MSRFSNVSRREIVAKTLIALVVVSSLAGTARPAAAAVEHLTIWLSARVEANATNAHTIRIGSENYVHVRGDGDTDLDCWLYSPAGQQVSRDVDETDHCILAAPGVGNHRLVIRNYGSVYNAYTVSDR